MIILEDFFMDASKHGVDTTTLDLWENIFRCWSWQLISMNIAIGRYYGSHCMNISKKINSGGGHWAGESLVGRSQNSWTFSSCLWSSSKVSGKVRPSFLSMTEIFQRHSVVAWAREVIKMCWKSGCGRSYSVTFVLAFLLVTFLLTFRWNLMTLWSSQCEPFLP